MPLNIAVCKPPLEDEDAKRVAAFIARGGQVVNVKTGVSLGMQKTKYLPREASGFGGKPAAPKLNTGDEKFDMYLNALPSELREWVVATEQNVRALYKEYRLLKKDGLLAKYVPTIDAWKAEQG